MDGLTQPFEASELHRLDGNDALPSREPALLTRETADAVMFDLLNAPSASVNDATLDGLFPELASTNTTSFTPVNQDVLPLTVSPKDLMMDVSAPPSSSMTNLSTPPQDFSPFVDYMSSTDTSPLYGHDGLPEDAATWNPLFPAEVTDEQCTNEGIHPCQHRDRGLAADAAHTLLIQAVCTFPRSPIFHVRRLATFVQALEED